MKQRSVVIALLLVFAATLNATKVELSFTNLPQYQVNGFYVGNSQATVGNVQMFDVLCGDFNHTTFIPSGPFTFSVSSIPSLTDVRFTGVDKLATYQTAAILLNLFDGLSAVNDYTAGSYQYAIWKLLTPTAGDYGDSATLLANAQYTAAHGGNAYAYDHFRVLTPSLSGAANQEFLAMDYGNQIAATATEPASVITIGAGLLLLGGAFKLRRFQV